VTLGSLPLPSASTPWAMPRGREAIGAVVGAAAVILGLLAGQAPLLALAAALGGIFVAIALGNLAAGLCVYAATSFAEAVAFAGSGVSLARLAGVLLVLSWLATQAAAGPSRTRFLDAHGALGAALIGLFAWAALSIAWAEETGETITAITRFGLNLAVFPIAYVALRRPRDVRVLLTILVVGALASATLGLVMEGGPAAAESERLEGAGINSNIVGQLLVVGFVLACGLAAAASTAAGRMLAVTGAALCAAGVVLSLSRGALVGMLAALLVGVLVAGRGRRLVVATAGLLALAAIVAYFAAWAPGSATARVTTVTSGTGRTDIWRVGWRMVEAHPVRGVGAGNFAGSTIHYLLKPGAIERSDFIVDRPKVAHNIYLQVLAELGVVGLGLFLAILAAALASMLRAARLFARAGDRPMDVLSRCVLVAAAAILVSDFFSSALHSKQLWLLLALGPALLGLATRSVARPGAPALRR
jgi:O-antigen ligase